jgi:hypothetical protein
MQAELLACQYYSTGSLTSKLVPVPIIVYDSDSESRTVRSPINAQAVSSGFLGNQNKLMLPYLAIWDYNSGAVTEVGSKQIYISEVYCQARTFMSGASLTHVAHNFISETSSSTSSSACTRSCLGVRVTRYGFGLRPDSPLYPSRDIGSSGSDRMSKAQSNRETASHNSRSATWMPAQMRRLRRVRVKRQR